MRPILCAIGFTSVIAQVVLIREFAAVFYGNELSFGLLLATWLIWTAVGSRLTGQLAPRFRLGRRSYAASLGLVALCLPLELSLIRALRTILGLTPGLMMGYGSMAWAMLFILAPLCLAWGFQFTLGSHLLAKEGGTVGQAYMLEGIGAAIGGVLFSFLLVRLLDPFQIALGIGAATSAAGFWVLRTGANTDSVPGGRAGSRLPFLFAAIVLVFVSLPLGARFNQTTLDWQWDHALFSADSIYGRLTVTGSDSQRIFFQNGLLMFETQGTFPEEVAHLPLLQHPNPESVLLLGGGASGTLREILKHPVNEVEYVELDPLLIRAAETHLPPDDRRVFEDPRVSIAYQDGRLHVAETAGHFDVVIIDLPEPSTGQLNRFYTQEFFEDAARILSDGGLFSLGLPSAENYISPELRHRNGGVYHTLLSVFPNVMVLPGEHNFFLCSRLPLSDDHLLLTERLAERGIETRWVNAAYLEYLFTTDRFEMTAASLTDIRPIRLNLDLRPICYFYDMVLWLTRFYGNLSDLFYAASLFDLWWMAIPLLLLGAVVWRFRGATVPAVVALTGFATMTVEVAVLLGFQALRGYIYHELALITAAFMLGTAIGASILNEWLGRTEERVRLGHRPLFVLLQASLFAYALLLPTLMTVAHALPLPDLLFPLLSMAAGFLGGMEFPLAAHLTSGRVAGIAGLIYSADLVGACFGALLSSVFLIPILGIPQTCYAVAVLALAGLVLLLLWRR
jgi:spermidine synthase